MMSQMCLDSLPFVTPFQISAKKLASMSLILNSLICATGWWKTHSRGPLIPKFSGACTPLESSGLVCDRTPCIIKVELLKKELPKKENRKNAEILKT